MSYSKADLRSFLAQVHESGKSLRVAKPVDPATEVAALCSETTRPLLLENIKGYPDFRIADCLTRYRDTQALALGISGGAGGGKSRLCGQTGPGAGPDRRDR